MLTASFFCEPSVSGQKIEIEQHRVGKQMSICEIAVFEETKRKYSWIRRADEGQGGGGIHAPPQFWEGRTMVYMLRIGSMWGAGEDCQKVPAANAIHQLISAK